MKIDNIKHFDEHGFSGDVYVTSEEKKGFSAIRVAVHGKRPRKKMADFTRAYFVVDGEGTFTIDDVTHKVQKYDLYVVEPGNEYEYEGTMTLFEFTIFSGNSFKNGVL